MSPYPSRKMNELTINQIPYLPPIARVVDFSLEYSFLQSNTEPIGGGDNPDIEW